MDKNLKGFIGSANHIHSDGSISTIIIGRFTFEMKTNITLRDGDESIIIHSKEQWEQIKAFVENNIDDMD